MALKDELNTRQAALREIINQIDTLRNNVSNESVFIENLSNSDEWPTEFTGTASKYRYRPGVAGTDGTHQFQLEVKKGLTLMMKVSDADWRLFLRTINSGKSVKSMGALVNGNTLRIARGDGERTRPIAVVETYPNTDKGGNPLFKGARVTDTATLREGVITGRTTDGYVDVKFDDGTTDKYGGDGLRLVA